MKYSFLTALFVAKWLSLLKSTWTDTCLLIPNLSTSIFKLAKFDFNAKIEVSTCVIYLISVFFGFFGFFA